MASEKRTLAKMYSNIEKGYAHAIQASQQHPNFAWLQHLEVHISSKRTPSINVWVRPWLVAMIKRIKLLSIISCQCSLVPQSLFPYFL